VPEEPLGEFVQLHTLFRLHLLNVDLLSRI
jgi:hypothetical protein